MELYLVRHAQTSMNNQKRLQGCALDPSLSYVGAAQAEKIAERLKSVSFDMAVCSPLKRAQETFARIASLHEDLACCLDERIKDRDWGDLTGGSSLSIDFLNLPPEVESIDSIVSRANNCFNDYFNSFPNGRILAVTHSGIIVNYLALISDTQFRVANSCVTIIKFNANATPMLVLEPCNKHLVVPEFC